MYFRLFFLLFIIHSEIAAAAHDCFEKYLIAGQNYQLEKIPVEEIKKIVFKDFDKYEIRDSMDEYVHCELSITGQAHYRVFKEDEFNEILFYPYSFAKDRSKSLIKLIIFVPPIHRHKVKEQKSTLCTIS